MLKGVKLSSYTRILITDVDQAQADLKHISVVLSYSDGVYEIGKHFGKLNQFYSRNQFLSSSPFDSKRVVIPIHGCFKAQG